MSLRSPDPWYRTVGQQGDECADGERRTIRERQGLELFVEGAVTIGGCKAFIVVRAVGPDHTSEPSTGEVFEEFFARNYELLLRALYLIAGDRYEAEDIAQETFVKAYERWDRIALMENPGGYLFRSAVNAHRSRLRRLAVGARRVVSRQEADPISAADERDTLRRALATLPDSQREAVVLTDWLGMTSEEAGKMLGRTPGAVRVQASRARESLRFLIERATM